MNISKTNFAALCCLLFLAGSFGAQGLISSIAGGIGAQGGAAQFVGRHDIKDSPYFAQPDIYNMKNNEHLLLLERFPTVQQTTGYTCGPAAANMVVRYFLGKELDSEIEVAKVMETSTTSGTNTKGMANYFTKIGWEVRSSIGYRTPDSYDDFLEFVSANLKKNTPIIVENVEWGGHWRVIIGYDTMGTKHTGDDVLLMADPFDTSDHLQDGYCVESAERFFYMWFDHQLFPRSEQKRQWVTAKPRH